MNYKNWKYLFLFFIGCGGNEHFRSRSDYHFWAQKYPKLTIKLNKVSNDGFFIYNTQENADGEESSKRKIYQAKSNKECSFEFELVEENEEDANAVLNEKEFKVFTSEGKEFYIKVTFSRQYQLINFDVGLGKIYHLKDISTNIPDNTIKTDYKNKMLYNTYVGENVIEIEY